MGIKRSDSKGQKGLNEGLKFAVAVESVGKEFTDYHTTLPPATEEDYHATRKEEIVWGTGDAVVTRRDYRVDSLHTASLWNAEGHQEPELKEIKESLVFPSFTPYLGRKSCPPSIPFLPKIIESKNLKQSFYQYWKGRPRTRVIRKFVGGNSIPIYWEATHPEPGMEVEEVVERKDQPLNRANWTFKKRSENKSVIKSE